MLARGLGLAVVWLLIAAGLWLVYRLVVLPYLVLTAEGYRVEHRARHAERDAQGLPFTRAEIDARGP